MNTIEETALKVIKDMGFSGDGDNELLSEFAKRLVTEFSSEAVAWRYVSSSDEGTCCHIYNEMRQGEPLFLAPPQPETVEKWKSLANANAHLVETLNRRADRERKAAQFEVAELRAALDAASGALIQYDKVMFKENYAGDALAIINKVLGKEE